MARLATFLRSSGLAALLIPIAAWALEVPNGTEIQVRLKTKISTLNAKEKDPIEAVVIAPVLADGQFAIPQGAAVRGIIEKTARSIKPADRALFLLTFNEIEID